MAAGAVQRSRKVGVEVGVDGLPPGPREPTLRQIVRFVWRPAEFMEECHRRYGEVFSARIQRGGHPFVFLVDPTAIREVLTGPPEVFRSGEANAVFSSLLGRYSLLVLDGPEHVRERRLMLPPFHGERMRSHQQMIGEIAERAVSRWPVGTPFPVATSTRAIALEIILRAVIGIDEADRLELLSARLRRVLDISSSPWSVLALLLTHPKGFVMRHASGRTPLLSSVNDLLFDHIARRRADPRLSERTDVLSILLQARDEDGAPLGDQHLRDELISLLLAGHETTATALAWALERLAHNPEVYERLADESAPDADAFMEATIQETLRLRPVFMFVVRQLAEPATIAGYRLPAGTVLTPCTHLVHRRPDIYPAPSAFRPERFLEESPGTYTWLPFGGGTRRCIGASFATHEMKTILRTITRAGRPLPADRAPETVRRRGITLAPSADARIVFQPHTTG
jgi:cytochrome P450